MINTKKWLERFLQDYRFKLIKPYLKGDVLDFGGNEGELKQFVNGSYTIVNYDHTPMENKTFDTIAFLAVLEHIEKYDTLTVLQKFKKALKPDGIVFLTTPTKMSKPLLEFLASVHILDKANIEEHKHYWTKEEIAELANQAGLQMVDYKKFQLGFNQMAILKHK